MWMSFSQHRRILPQNSVSALIQLSGLLACLTDAVKIDADVKLAETEPVMNVEHGIHAGSSDLNHLIEAKFNDSSSAKLLSRQRRYLVFPEGSSFQMVFDEIICVVDYTNYLVVGVTAALAWELPSQPPSEAYEDLLTKLNDGTIDVSRNDTVSNITYADDSTILKPSTTKNKISYKPNYIHFSNGGNTKGLKYSSYYGTSSVFRPPMHGSHQYADSFYIPRPRTGMMKQARRKNSHYYRSRVRHPFKQRSKSHSPAQKTRFPYWALPSHMQEQNRFYRPIKKLRQQNRQQKAPPIPPISSRAPPRRHHQIYPVYGKRSIPDPVQLHQHHRRGRSGTTSLHDEHLTRRETNQIKYHRNSRQRLYERIEKYLDKRGQNGHQCVLRTLCETGKKSQEQKPGSFVGELLRAVFTIPEALDHEQADYRDTRYDKAHANAGDCAIQYPECKQSILNAPFVQ